MASANGRIKSIPASRIKMEALKSQKSPDNFLGRNIREILAILIVLLSFFMFGKVLFFPAPKEESNIDMMIVGALISVISAIVSYYFGASRQDPHEKTSQIAKNCLNQK